MGCTIEHIYVVKAVKKVTMSGTLRDEANHDWVIVDGSNIYRLTDWLEKFENAHVQISIKRWDTPSDDAPLLDEQTKAHAQVWEP